MKLKWLFGILTVAACCLQASPARAQVEGQLSLLAKNLASELQKAGHSSSTLKVNGPTTFPSSGPSMVKEILGAELVKLGVTIKKLGANVGIAADLKITEVRDEDSNTVSSIALSLSVNIVDRNESPIGAIDTQKINITDRGDVSRMLGVPFETGGGPGDLPPGVPPPDAGTPGGGPTGGAALVQAVKNPNQGIKGTTIRAKEDGQFGIELIVSGTAHPVTLEEGFAMCELAQSDKCQVRLINDSDYECGVRLALDGVDCFWFSKQKVGYWIVGPHSSVLVKGWQLNNNQAREFTIVPFAQSVAAQAGVTGEIGVICASFYRSYKDHEPIPAYDNPPPTKSLGIGAGNLVQNAVKIVHRKFGLIRACVPVRYEKPQQ